MRGFDLDALDRYITGNYGEDQHQGGETMLKVQITLDVYDESADPEDRTGVTEEVYEQLVNFLMGFGEDVKIERSV